MALFVGRIAREVTRPHATGVRGSGFYASVGDAPEPAPVFDKLNGTAGRGPVGQSVKPNFVKHLYAASRTRGNSRGQQAGNGERRKARFAKVNVLWYTVLEKVQEDNETSPQKIPLIFSERRRVTSR